MTVRLANTRKVRLASRGLFTVYVLAFESWNNVRVL